ncbi:MAG: hypothetical protein BMS9Abin12_1973 [Acidimicrobiia bacterium]|nr:MAG: hypothetical protein BMS9Abin12_1973 [Acidimicrobiia bacterium]
MNRALVLIVVFGLMAAACSGTDSDGVASLRASSTTIAQDSSVDSAAGDEEILLEFAACMRDNGVDDFEDPTFNSDGVPEFNIRGSDTDRETTQAAFEACKEKLEGLAIGPGSVDLTEVQDTLVEFAGCMRDNGYDMPDPDIASFRGPGGGPFGGQIDPDDPDFISAMEECESIFQNLPFVGGSGSGGRGGNG